ncbi:MAG: IMP dehydrogenase [Candidatus Muirbacterium halophilum]|nr:IMP dehydrogenase [Candidatus Muirbacterium halophilum]
MKYKLKKINKKTIKNENVIDVYDITVKDDHSYTVGGVIVHNCLTTEKLGVGYPSASLIKECYDISCTLDNPAKIIMDGGLKEERDFIKSFALGADFCMSGGVFNKALESCADTYTQNKKHDWGTEPGELVDQFNETTKQMFRNGTRFFKKFRGMSTKEVQKSLGNKVLKTSEGISRMNEVEYTLSGWTENFTHYLSSAMSYTNKDNLKDFVGNVEVNLITQNAFKRFNK